MMSWRSCRVTSTRTRKLETSSAVRAVCGSCAGPGRGVGSAAGYASFNYLRLEQGEIWLLTLYAKNETESIPGSVLKKIEEIDG